MITTIEQLQQAINNQQEIIEIDGQFDYDLSLITHPCKIIGTPGSKMGCYSAGKGATFSICLNGWCEVPTEQQVLEIKSKFVAGKTSKLQLAKEYKVSSSCVDYILQNEARLV